MEVKNENVCAFYASDYHLEMIMLPYINKNLKQNKKVYVFTQNNLEETMNTLLKKVNIKNELREEVLKINWKNEDENKYKELIKEKNDTIVFVKGNEKYIEKTNENLNQIKEYKTMEIVDCFNLEEVQNNISNIIVNHKNILTTDKK